MAKQKYKRNKSKDKSKVEKQSRSAVLSFLKANPKRAYNHKQIAAGANIKGRVSHHKLMALLEDLVDRGKVESVQRGKYRVLAQTIIREGVLQMARDGFGFVTPDSGGDDIFIGQRNINKALNGDVVKVKIVRGKRRGGGAEGEILEVVERGRSEFIGTIENWDRIYYMVPDDPKLGVQFFIAPENLMGAKHGDKVLVELLGWERRTPDGKVVRVLGKAGENQTEMHAILFQFGFRPEFPADVEAEAQAFGDKIPAAEVRKRRDFRDVPTFTIDPVDAKDFDDALSYRVLENGHIEVGVHIADVSYYVRPGTRLDEEAFDRATSVYLVDRTVSMLPEALSNDLCSLKPNVDRLAFSAVFEMGPRGKVHKEWFGRTVIHSDRRFHYAEVQGILDAGEGEYYDELNDLNRLAKILRNRRFKSGSINFDEDEVRFELDENDKPIRVYRKIRTDSHKMIEDWMLLANRKVAQYIAQKQKHPPLPFVYRIHDRPDQDKLAKLREFVALLGYTLDLGDEDKVAISLNSLMGNVDGKPESHLVHTVAVRSMAKAIYSTENIGHYGLGFRFYTHFTSPIRRYPDLLVHRYLDQYLGKDFTAGNALSLEKRCVHASKMERKAVEAERASIKYKQVEFLEDKIGQEFEGVVSGVTKWGIYVELTDNKCEGMVSLQDLEGDYWEVDEEQFCVRARVSGEVIRLGDKVLIEIKDTNLRRRQIDFWFIEVVEESLKPLLPVAPPVSTPVSKPGGSFSKSARRRSRK